MAFGEKFNKWIWSPLGHIFRVRTIAQIVGGGTLITSVGGGIMYAQSHWDLLSLVFLFMVSVALIAWSKMTPREQSQNATNENSRLVEATPPARSFLKINYKAPRNNERPKFVLKVRDGSPSVKIKRIGPLVSEERYLNEVALSPLQQEIPEVDAGEPVECQFFPELGPLVDLGGPMTKDSITVSYEVVGTGEIIQSQYFLHKNMDGSIVLSNDMPPVEPKDLKDLRYRLRMLKDAATCFAMAEVCEGLVSDVTSVRERLESGQHYDEFNRPLSPVVHGDPIHVSELSEFRHLYLEHLVRAEASKVSYSSLLKSMGDEAATYQEVLDSIHKYQMTLTNMAANIRRSYAALAKTEIGSATKS